RTPLESAFPRKEMVWAQWGLEDKLLTDGDAWLCYQCNDCITHCPVDARPGDVMAAARNLQMEEYSVPRFMNRITRDPKAILLAVAIPAALVGLLVLGATAGAPGAGIFPKGDVLFSRFLGDGYVDIFAMSIVVIVAVLSYLSLRKFWAGLQSTVPEGTPRAPLATALRGTLAEVFPRIGIHHHHNVLSLPIWDPVKIVGNVGGVALLAGLAQTLWVRLTRPEQSGKSTYSDWFFSGLLGLFVVTGVVTEILRYGQVHTAAYVSYTVHLVCIF